MKYNKNWGLSRRRPFMLFFLLFSPLLILPYILADAGNSATHDGFNQTKADHASGISAASDSYRIEEPGTGHALSSLNRSQNIRQIVQLGGPSYTVAAQGNYAYLGEGSVLVVLDISNPAAPQFIGARPRQNHLFNSGKNTNERNSTDSYETISLRPKLDLYTPR